MKLHIPEYFQNFNCIADKCTDSCCIGWEIDIDEKTAKLYETINHEFGDKLKQNIDFNQQPHFILNKNNRCPFLNEKNLCDIYINLGKDKLCHICSEHPRFYEWFGDIKEGGIGLCCEEACRLILSYDKDFSIIETTIPNEESNTYNNELYSYLYSVREKIITYIETKFQNIDSCFKDILNYTKEVQNCIDNNNYKNMDIFSTATTQTSSFEPILNFYLTLEPLDNNWISNLQKNIPHYLEFKNLKINFEENNNHILNYLKNISIYFVWRYFLKGIFDKDIISKINLMVISTHIIEFLFFCKWKEKNKLSLEDCIEITKNYSKEIEYSESNLSEIFNQCNDSYFFSSTYLIETLNYSKKE